jgi:hypothetical protein
LRSKKSFSEVRDEPEAILIEVPIAIIFHELKWSSIGVKNRALHGEGVGVELKSEYLIRFRHQVQE